MLKFSATVLFGAESMLVEFRVNFCPVYLDYLKL